MPCQYRQENRPVRDPTLSLIFDRLNQLQDSVQAVEGRLMKLDASSPRPTRPPTKFVHGVPSPDSTRDDYIRPSTVPESNAEQSDLHRRSPQPASDVLRWDCCRRCFPRLSSKYQDPDRFSNYSGIPNSNLSISLLLQPEPAAETGQVFSHVRNFLDHVYPLYPIVCEQAISDMTTEFIREGPRTNIQSALVLLMVCLAKLLVSGNPSDELTAENDLDGAVQILNWVPLENSLEHAQAQFLAALCFSKFSMLSTSVAFLQRSSAVLYEFLLRKVLSSAQIKLTTRTTSVRLYWVVLNLERDLCWETPLYTLGPLSQLEDRLPLPMECMVQNAASANTAGQSETYHSAIDACYPLFLAETSLRQICWRVSSAPELQEDFASAKESHVYSPGSSSSPNATLVLPVVTELSSQVSRWLECVPAAANWSPKAEPGPVTPLSTRVKLLYWMCRFNVHKSALRHVSLYNDSLEVADGLTQVRAKAALEAAARSLYVFCEENFAADEVLAHRYSCRTLTHLPGTINNGDIGC